MSRKHFQAIAAILNRANGGIVLAHVIQDMADYLSTTNKHFDPDKFIAACYIEREE